MAKGKEDTAFYRESRLVSRCEVGDDPFASGLDTMGLHAALAQLWSTHPRTMTALSTHDTKRSEDVRARLSVLSELPERWRDAARRWMDRTAQLDPDGLVDARTRYQLLQNLVGAHPIDADRLGEHALKSAREAKEATSWTRPDPAYEEALAALVRTVCDDELLCAEVTSLVEEDLDPPGRRTEVAQKVLQLMAPGVADLYWGSEDRLHRLVDPDNRVPPALQQLRGNLAAVRDGDVDPDGTRRSSQRCRRWWRCGHATRAAACPAATSRSMSQGPTCDRVAAFGRGDHLAVVVTRWPGRGPMAAGTTVDLPAGTWRVRLGGCSTDDGSHGGGAAEVAELLGGWSAAVLERDR